jgi:hypothetical protein
LHYAVNQLPLIEPFFEDCRSHLDKNAIENKIRPLALQMVEKFLICRFPWGEEADVNPYAWMTNTLNRIGNHPVNKLAELLPNNFKKL